MKLDLDSPYYLIELIIKTLEYYDIGKFKSLIRIIKSYDNFLVAFNTDKGDYVMKIYKRYYHKSKLIYSLNEIENVIKLGFTNLPICFTKNNEIYLKLDSEGFNEIITIDKFISNKIKYDPENDQMLIDSAKLLADLHNKTKKKSINKNDFRIIFEDFSELNDFFGEENSKINLFEEFKNKKNKSDEEKIIESEVFSFIKNELECLKIISKNFQKENDYSCIIHGDFMPGQIIFEKNDTINLIDYEHFKWSFNGYDLARAIFHFPRNKLNGEIDEEKIKLFLKKYFEIVDKNLECFYEDVLFLIRFISLKILRNNISSIISDKKGNVDYLNLTLNHIYKRAKWFSENKDLLERMWP